MGFPLAGGSEGSVVDDRLPVSQLLASIQQNWPEMLPLVQPGVLYLYRARDLAYQDLVATLKPAGLLPADLDVLAALRVRPPPRELTPTELYRSLLLSSGGLTKILGRLEAAGWVERHPNPQDRRSRLVRLSPEGARLLDELGSRVVAHQVRFLQPLDAGDQAELTRLLTKLVSSGGG